MNDNLDIIMFACIKWGYGAADLAGVSRSKYSPTVKIIKIRCTGRVDVRHLLFAIKSGADGVMVVGWRPNECQYKDGNFKAQTHVDFANRILERRGFGNQRINQYWLSSAESDKLVISIKDCLEKILKAGPNPLKEIKKKLEKAIPAPVDWIL